MCFVSHVIYVYVSAVCPVPRNLIHLVCFSLFASRLTVLYKFISLWRATIVVSGTAPSLVEWRITDKEVLRFHEQSLYLKQWLGSNTNKNNNNNILMLYLHEDAFSKLWWAPDSFKQFFRSEHFAKTLHVSRDAGTRVQYGGTSPPALWKGRQRGHKCPYTPVS